MASRGADFLQGAVVRPLMLVLWCGVVWGSFILVAWGWVLVSAGGGSALQALARLSWPNRLAGLLALAVWSVGAALWWHGRTAGAEK
jgi:hypothetical protein